MNEQERRTLGNAIAARRRAAFGTKSSAYTKAGVNAATWDRAEAGLPIREDRMIAIQKILWPSAELAAESPDLMGLAEGLLPAIEYSEYGEAVQATLQKLRVVQDGVLDLERTVAALKNGGTGDGETLAQKTHDDGARLKAILAEVQAEVIKMRERLAVASGTALEVDDGTRTLATAEARKVRPDTPEE